MERMRGIIRQLLRVWVCRRTCLGLQKKVDTMILKAIGLLEESYSHHFPELAYVVSDNILYVKVVKLMENRTTAATLDFTEVLPEEIETQLTAIALISWDLSSMNWISTISRGSLTKCCLFRVYGSAL
ncbi:hypothetical protein MKW98_030667 [Papaver atlanticum]|uniref:NOSIC domain-containing protein n=1 Tax=Papaver atlanticum TaxID=357466 RepID=A0AAD4RUM1_9MAGN|nr:hypothetical protein MKW98_030667 [Papaver atlanticum]